VDWVYLTPNREKKQALENSIIKLSIDSWRFHDGWRNFQLLKTDCAAGS
jgi:hypothetical protein